MKAADTSGKTSTFLDWRNWPLLTKLGAVVLVPVIFAVSLGVSQIQWQVDRANQFHQVADKLDAVDVLEPLVNDIQTERTLAVEVLVGSKTPDMLPQRADATDARAREAASLFRNNESYGPVVSARYDDLRAQLDAVKGLRQQVANRQVDPQTVIGAYSKLVNATLALDLALTSTIADPSLASSATAIQGMVVLMEEVRLQQAWVHTGIGQGRLDPAVLQVLVGSRARLTAKVEEVGSIVAPHWRKRLDETMAGSAVVERNQLLTALVVASSDPDSDGAFFAADDWNARCDRVIDLIADGHNDLSAEVRNGAWELEENASNAAGRDSVFLMSALILALIVIIMISRQLLRSLRELRRSALRSARRDLPEAVASIRAGDDTDAMITPVPVDTTEEVGQVARAFEVVNQQALRLAAEQAALRHGYSESFVGVSRRSQALLERQLRLFEELEQDEEDPDQLARLFQLDHLATRMRRNNENLMVLSGTDPARRFSRPTELADVLRAAMSEIEQYPRVILQPPPSVRLLGHVASDLVRLMAELFDNAANFSSPETSVTVSSYQAGDGSVTIDVLDEGIGMSSNELMEANQNLAQVNEDDLATSRRMGLFVVGRLAVRHGITVELHGGQDVQGVRATVLIPPELMLSQESSTKSRMSPVAGGQRNGFAHQDMPTSGVFSAPGVSEGSGYFEQPTGFTEQGSGYFEQPTGFTEQGTGFTEQGTGFTEQPTGFTEQPTGFTEQPTGFTEQRSSSSLPRREPSDSSSSLPRRDPSSSRSGMFDATPSGPLDASSDSWNAFAEADAPPQPVDPLSDPIETLTGSLGTQSRPVDAEDRPTETLFTPLVDASEQADGGAYDSSFDWPLAPEEPVEEGQVELPAPPGRNETSTQWFQPASQDAQYQAMVETNGGGLWPADGDEPGPGGAEAGDESADSKEEGSSLTAGGLPRRKKSSRTAPAENENENESGSTRRSPQELSRQLADMQGGLQFGPAEAEPASAPEPAAQPDTGGWSFATDDAWRQAEAAVNQDPTSYTASGLPRRTPKAQLAPGSISSAEEEPTRRYQRNADELRGRLSSFQSGVQRGRHRAPDEV